MKKIVIFILLILFFVFCFTLNAKDKDFRFIFSGGLSLANLHESTELEKNSFHNLLVNLRGSFGIEKKLSDNIFCEFDLMFSPIKIDIEDQGEGMGGTFYGNVITLPLLLKYKLFSGSTPYIFGGPEVGLILNLENNDGDLTEFKRFYFGFMVGGGYEFKISSKVNLCISAQKRINLSNQYKTF